MTRPPMARLGRCPIAAAAGSSKDARARACSKRRGCRLTEPSLRSEGRAGDAAGVGGGVARVGGGRTARSGRLCDHLQAHLCGRPRPGCSSHPETIISEELPARSVCTNADRVPCRQHRENPVVSRPEPLARPPRRTFGPSAGAWGWGAGDPLPRGEALTAPARSPAPSSRTPRHCSPRPGARTAAPPAAPLYRSRTDHRTGADRS